MYGSLKIVFNNGETFAANIKGRGTNDLEEKARHISNRLEKPGRRELVEWHLDFRAMIPGREFVRVNSRGYVSGPVYRTDCGADIRKDLR